MNGAIARCPSRGPNGEECDSHTGHSGDHCRGVLTWRDLIGYTGPMQFMKKGPPIEPNYVPCEVVSPDGKRHCKRQRGHERDAQGHTDGVQSWNYLGEHEPGAVAITRSSTHCNARHPDPKMDWCRCDQPRGHDSNHACTRDVGGLPRLLTWPRDEDPKRHPELCGAPHPENGDLHCQLKRGHPGNHQCQRAGPTRIGFTPERKVITWPQAGMHGAPEACGATLEGRWACVLDKGHTGPHVDDTGAKRKEWFVYEKPLTNGTVSTSDLDDHSINTQARCENIWRGLRCEGDLGHAGDHYNDTDNNTPGGYVWPNNDLHPPPTPIPPVKRGRFEEPDTEWAARRKAKIRTITAGQREATISVENLDLTTVSTGEAPEGHWVDCPQCRETGQVLTADGMKPCPMCQGFGKIVALDVNPSSGSIAVARREHAASLSDTVDALNRLRVAIDIFGDGIKEGLDATEQLRKQAERIAAFADQLRRTTEPPVSREEKIRVEGPLTSEKDRTFNKVLTEEVMRQLETKGSLDTKRLIEEMQAFPDPPDEEDTRELLADYMRLKLEPPKGTEIKAQGTIRIANGSGTIPITVVVNPTIPANTIELRAPCAECLAAGRPLGGAVECPECHGTGQSVVRAVVE